MVTPLHGFTLSHDRDCCPDIGTGDDGWVPPIASITSVTKMAPSDPRSPGPRTAETHIETWPTTPEGLVLLLQHETLTEPPADKTSSLVQSPSNLVSRDRVKGTGMSKRDSVVIDNSTSMRRRGSNRPIDRSRNPAVACPPKGWHQCGRSCHKVGKVSTGTEIVGGQGYRGPISHRSAQPWLIVLPAPKPTALKPVRPAKESPAAREAGRGRRKRETRTRSWKEFLFLPRAETVCGGRARPEHSSTQNLCASAPLRYNCVLRSSAGAGTHWCREPF